MRPETGPMKFGDDWRGLFVRGDDAFGHQAGLAEAIRLLSTTAPVGEAGQHWVIVMRQLGRLQALLASTDERTATGTVQAMKTIEECVAGEVRLCGQCHDEFVVGTGATEPAQGSRVRLTERFCSESCADAWEREFTDVIEDC